jgi:hypothetical protein
VTLQLSQFAWDQKIALPSRLAPGAPCCSGNPLREAVAARGPSVINTKDELKASLADSGLEATFGLQ